MIRGTGTIIRETLAAWKITAHSGCGCTEIAAEMDAVGADVVEQNLDHYVDRMYESVKLWRSSGNTLQQVLPLPPKVLVKELIQYAITKHREEANLCTLL